MGTPCQCREGQVAAGLGTPRPGPGALAAAAYPDGHWIGHCCASSDSRRLAPTQCEWAGTGPCLWFKFRHSVDPWLHWHRG